jgi:hypothetical protein
MTLGCLLWTLPVAWGAYAAVQQSDGAGSVIELFRQLGRWSGGAMVCCWLPLTQSSFLMLPAGCGRLERCARQVGICLIPLRLDSPLCCWMTLW